MISQLAVWVPCTGNKAQPLWYVGIQDRILFGLVFL